MTPAERDLLWLLKAWLAHRRSGWTHPCANFYSLCWFVRHSTLVFTGFDDDLQIRASIKLKALLIRDFGNAHNPFYAWNGHSNPERVAWVRKTIKELESKQ